MPVLPFVFGWLVPAAAPTPSVAAGFRHSGEPIDHRVPGGTPSRVATTYFEAHRGAGTIRRNAGNGSPVLAEVTGPDLVQHPGIAPAIRPRWHIRAGAGAGAVVVRAAIFWSSERPGPGRAGR